MPTPRRLTDEEIEELVGRVVAGGAGTLERAVHEAIWPDGDAPEEWGDWPKVAIQVWDRCVEVYIQGALRDVGGKGWSKNTLGLDRSWEVILAVCADPATWWELGASWARIAEELDLTRRVATYRMEALGWKFSDTGGRASSRRVLRAPCRRCGESCVPHDLDQDQKGPCCRPE